jgi:Spy/CpxP family protein refolding chaperone
LLGAAGAVFAFGGPHHGPGGCDRTSPREAVEQVEGLSDAQREQLDKLFTEQRTAMKTRMEAMRDNRKALRQAMRDGAGMEEIQKLADEQGVKVSAMIMAKAQMRSKLAEILSTEQLEQLQDSWGERHGGFGRHHRW